MKESWFRVPPGTPIYAPVAQLVEQETLNFKVVVSSTTRCTNIIKGDDLFMPFLGEYEYMKSEGHSRANKFGFICIHIDVAERVLGRPLKSKEVVHHKDKNKLNNCEDNIMVFATKADHTCYHSRNCDDSLLIKNEDGSYSCERVKLLCVDCGAVIKKGSTRCVSCNHIYSRTLKNRPLKGELFDLLKQNKGNFSALSRMYGVSDNAIRKWCKIYGIPSHSKDYK